MGQEDRGRKEDQPYPRPTVRSCSRTPARSPRSPRPGSVWIAARKALDTYATPYIPLRSRRSNARLLADLRLPVGEELPATLVFRDDLDLDQRRVKVRVAGGVGDHIEQDLGGLGGLTHRFISLFS